MSPKNIIGTNSAETEKVTDETAKERRDAQNKAVLERQSSGSAGTIDLVGEDKNKESSSENPDKRATDQDAAIENAFVSGALPEEDRRRNLAEAGNQRSPRPTTDAEAALTPADGGVAPLPGDPNPQTVVTNRAIPAGRRQFIGPDGTQRDVSIVQREEHGVGRILATLPPGSRVNWTNEGAPAGAWTVFRGPGINAVGHGPTLRRAVRMVGAKMGRHPEDQLRTVLLDEMERPIHGNPDTDPDPSDPNDKPKEVDGQGNVVQAVSATDNTVGPEAEPVPAESK